MFVSILVYRLLWTTIISYNRNTCLILGILLRSGVTRSNRVLIVSLPWLFLFLIYKLLSVRNVFCRRRRPIYALFILSFIGVTEWHNQEKLPRSCLTLEYWWRFILSPHFRFPVLLREALSFATSIFSFRYSIIYS